MKVAHDLETLNNHYARLLVVKVKIEIFRKTFIREQSLGIAYLPTARWIYDLAVATAYIDEVTRWEEDNLRKEI